MMGALRQNLILQKMMDEQAPPENERMTLADIIQNKRAEKAGIPYAPPTEMMGPPASLAQPAPTTQPALTPQMIKDSQAMRGVQEDPLERQTKRALLLNALFSGAAGAGDIIGRRKHGTTLPLYERLAGRIGQPLRDKQAMDAEQAKMMASQKAVTEKPKEKRKMTDSTEFKMAAGKQIPQEIQMIKEWMDQPGMSGVEWKKLMGPWKGKVRQLAGQKFEFGKAAAEWEGRLKPVQQMYGRFMEGGVLRKEDEIKYEKQFPQITDSPEIAKFKLDVVNGLSTRYYNSLLDIFTAQDYNVKGYERAKALGQLDNEIVIMESPDGKKRVPKDMVDDAENKGWVATEEKFSDNIKGGGSGEEMVSVISPDGKSGKLPRKNLEKAIKAGYKEVK
jgi:hypothetical protein